MAITCGPGGGKSGLVVFGQSRVEAAEAVRTRKGVGTSLWGLS